MINALKADFYKLKHQKSLWICLIVLCAMMLFVMVIFRVAMPTVLYVDETTGEEILYGDYYDVPSTARDYVYFAANYSNLLLILIILVALLFVTEYVHGTIRNDVASGVRRWQLFASKAVWMAVICFAFTAIIMLFTLIFSLMLFGEYGAAFNGKEFGYLLLSWLTQSLVYTAYAVIFMFIGVLTRSVGATIAVGIIFFSIGGDVVNLMSVLLVDVMNMDWLVKVSDYLLSGLAAYSCYPDIIDGKILASLFYMPAVFVAMFGGLGTLVACKRDVK